MNNTLPHHNKRKNQPAEQRHGVILAALERDRIVPVADLARQLNVVEKTVRRDVEALRDLGHRISGAAGLIMKGGPG